MTMWHDYKKLRTYRIEWRAHLNTLWTLVDGRDERDAAMACAEDFFNEHGGQVRVVTQHVIAGKGLGADSLGG